MIMTETHSVIDNRIAPPEPDTIVRPPSSILSLLLILVARWRVFAYCCLAMLTVALVTILALPTLYAGETRILPPQQPQSLSAVLLGQLGPLAGLAGKDLMKSSTDLYISMLRSRTVADGIITKYKFQSVYGEKRLAETREKLDRRTSITAGRDGIIVISFEDEDANRAANVANSYVGELFRLTQTLANDEASQRRVFFDKELRIAKDNLTNAEAELKATQEKTGLIQLDAQARAIIEGVASVQGRIAAKEVQLRAMRSFGTEQNPDIVRTEQELIELRGQLAQMERGHKAETGSIQVATGRVPEIGLEYVRRLRDVKYNEAIFDILARQFESAKLDEAKSAPAIQVVDVAVVPELKSSPKRGLLILIAIVMSIVLASLWILVTEMLAALLADPVEQERFQRLQIALGRDAHSN